MGSIWDHFGINLGSIWDHFGINLGSFWIHFEVILGSSGNHLGQILTGILVKPGNREIHTNRVRVRLTGSGYYPLPSPLLSSTALCFNAMHTCIYPTPALAKPRRTNTAPRTQPTFRSKAERAEWELVVGPRPSLTNG